MAGRDTSDFSACFTTRFFFLLSVAWCAALSPPLHLTVCICSRPRSFPSVDTALCIVVVGIVVQLAGSKMWMLYDEMVPFPRPDLKYKPASADLGEPIAVLELHPGDMMYIPRWDKDKGREGACWASGGVGNGGGQEDRERVIYTCSTENGERRPLFRRISLAWACCAFSSRPHARLPVRSFYPFVRSFGRPFVQSNFRVFAL